MTTKTEATILSIDAWGNGQDGWEWNSWHKVGTIPALELASLQTDQELIEWMIDNDYMTERSIDRAYIDDDGYNFVFKDKADDEPVFAIEYGPLFN